MDRDVVLGAAALRTRIDRAGRNVWEHAVGASVGDQMKKHEARAFLGAAALADSEMTISHYRLLAQVYSELSDVMHGRWRAAHFTNRQVDEWTTVVDSILGEE